MHHTSARTIGLRDRNMVLTELSSILKAQVCINRRSILLITLTISIKQTNFINPRTALLISFCSILELIKRTKLGVLEYNSDNIILKSILMSILLISFLTVSKRGLLTDSLGADLSFHLYHILIAIWVVSINFIIKETFKNSQILPIENQDKIISHINFI